MVQTSWVLVVPLGWYKHPLFKAGTCHLVKATAKEMSLTGGHYTLKGTVVDAT